MGKEVKATEVAHAGKKSVKSSGAKVEGDCEKKEEIFDGVEKSGIQKMDVDSKGKEDGQMKEEQGIRKTKKNKGNDKESKQAKTPRRHERKKITGVERDTGKNEVEKKKEIKTPKEVEEKKEIKTPKEVEEKKEIKTQKEVEEKKEIKAQKEVEEKKEIKTPTVSANRPVRERKSVERLVTSIEREPVKEFFVEKGSGSALKDIPNVAYKLSKRKADDTLKLLHTILFARRAKAAQVKSNISLFSGYVWSDNEEKQKIKVKEKLDKCVKEKLVEFCDVLDLPTPKVNTRKEDIVAKLIDFLVAPHATSSELLSEKEQGKKRKRITKPGASTPASAPSKKSSLKSRKRNGDVSKEREEDDTPGTENELVDKEKEAEDKELRIEETTNGTPESKVSHSTKGENKDESEEKAKDDTSRIKKVSKKSSAKKEIAGNGKRKEVSSPKKSSPIKKMKTLTSASKSPKVNGISDTTSKASSKKKTEVAKEKASLKEKSPPKEKPGKKGVGAKAKTKEEKSIPSDEELKAAVCEILKEADFNTATFRDILRILGERFKTDITSRKSSVKTMVENELDRIADEADDDEDDDGDDDDEDEAPVEKDEIKRVKA